MSSLTELIPKLPELSKEEQLALKAVLDRLVDKEVMSSSAPLTAVYSAMRRSFNHAGLDLSLPQGILFKEAKDRKSAEKFYRWSTKWFKVSSNAEFIRVLSYLVSLVLGYLDDLSVPCTPKVVIRNLVNISSIFNLSFPGYLASGMSSIIVERLHNVESRTDHN